MNDVSGMWVRKLSSFFRYGCSVLSMDMPQMWNSLVPMQCSDCGKCCERTEMLLSNEDIERLERAGFSREDFTLTCGDGLARLRNVGKCCYFYDPAEEKCQVYEDRPRGCRLYPIVHSIDEGVIADRLCPMRHTVSKNELKMKEKILLKHLKAITSEATPASIKEPHA